MHKYTVIFGVGKTSQSKHNNVQELKSELLEIYKYVCFHNYEDYDLYVYDKKDIDITNTPKIQKIIREIIKE